MISNFYWVVNCISNYVYFKKAKKRDMICMPFIIVFLFFLYVGNYVEKLVYLNTSSDTFNKAFLGEI